MEKINNKKSIKLKFNLENGLTPDRKPIKRMLSQMEGMFLDNNRLKDMIKSEDIVIYEFYDLKVPETSGDLAYGTTILYPGKVGDEYFMTKGHFHKIINTAEIYYCLKGNGYMLMESMNGDIELQEMTPGVSVYVPPSYAHRSINISSYQPLISFFAFRADAGHDYKTIESKGFRKLLMEKNGKPILIDNPKWKGL
ncbi:MAG: glucose-6-phosphate isomerase [Candidatus Thorarchaeota archaeon]